MYFVLDCSTNGTLVNNVRLEKGTKTLLTDGDELLIVFGDKGKEEAYFGIKFAILDEATAPLAPIPTKEELLSTLHRRRKVQRRKRNRENDEMEFERRRWKLMRDEGLPDDFDGQFNDNSFNGSSPSSMSGDSLSPNSKKMTTKPWTLDEEEKLKRVLVENEGKTWRDIAVHFPHRTADAVRNKAKKMHEMKKLKSLLPSSSARKEDEQMPLEHTQLQVMELSLEQNSMDLSSDSLILSSASTATEEDDEDRRRKPWTPEEDEKLRELVKKIKPSTPEQFEIIAIQLGRTAKSIKHKFNDYNLKVLMEE